MKHIYHCSLSSTSYMFELKKLGLLFLISSFIVVSCLAQEEQSVSESLPRLSRVVRDA